MEWNLEKKKKSKRERIMEDPERWCRWNQKGVRKKKIKLGPSLW